MKAASEPRETGDMFRFIREKRPCFPGEDIGLSNSAVNLVSTTPKYGIIFVGHKTTIKVFSTSSVLAENSGDCYATLTVDHEITHLSTSCDGLTLMVVINANNTPLAKLYDVRAIYSQKESAYPFLSAPMSTTVGSKVLAIAWNPMDPNCVAVTTTVGDLFMLNIKDNAVDISSKKGIKAYSLGWSAKGKQLTVGCSDGTLSLFKPDLTPVRVVGAPPSESPGPVLSLVWFSNTEFFIVCLFGNLPSLLYVNAPKNKPAEFVNFEDVCYSAETDSIPNYYMSYCPEWNLLLVLSSHGIEVAVVGRPLNSTDPTHWQQWNPEESGRAEMHMINVTQETFPLGMAIDFTSSKTFRTKDEKQEGPYPVIYSLSTGGELNIFHVDLREPGAPSLVTPTEPLPQTGTRTIQQYGGVPPPAVAPPHPSAGSIAPTGSTLPQFGGSLSAGKPTAQFGGLSTPKPEIPQFGAALPTAKASTPSFGSSIPTTKPSLQFGASTGLFTSTPASTVGTPQTGALAKSLFGGTSLSMSQSMFTTSKPSDAPTNLTAAAQAPDNKSTLPTSTASGLSFSGSLNFGSNTLKLETPKAEPPSNFSFSSPLKPGESLFSSTAPPKSPAISAQLPTFASTPVASPSSKPASAMPAANFSTSAQRPMKPVPLAPSGSISQGTPLVAPIPTMPVNKSAKSTQNGSENKNKISNISDAKLLSMIKEENEMFEKELQNHLRKKTQQISDIGSTEDKKLINEKISSSQSWLTEMQTTKDEQCNEVSQLHSMLLKSFTMLEEANSHEEKKHNHKHRATIESRPLDPYSQNKLKMIRNKYQYLVAQLQSANEKLEDEWESFSDLKKKKKTKPLNTSENFYQLIFNNCNRRNAYDKELDVIAKRLKKLHLVTLSSFMPNSSDLNESLNKTNLDDSVLDELERSLRNATIENEEQISISPLRKTSNDKKMILKEIFSKRQHIPLRLPTTENYFIQTSKLTSDTSEYDSSTASTGSGTKVQTPSTPNTMSLQKDSFITSTINKNKGASAKPKYEDISPPTSPINTAKTLNNPLNALSSLVGNVATPPSTPPTLNSSFPSAFSSLSSKNNGEIPSLKVPNFTQFKLPTQIPTPKDTSLATSPKTNLNMPALATTISFNTSSIQSGLFSPTITTASASSKETFSFANATVKKEPGELKASPSLFINTSQPSTGLFSNISSANSLGGITPKIDGTSSGFSFKLPTSPSVEAQEPNAKVIDKEAKTTNLSLFGQSNLTANSSSTEPVKTEQSQSSGMFNFNTGMTLNTSPFGATQNSTSGSTTSIGGKSLFTGVTSSSSSIFSNIQTATTVASNTTKPSFSFSQKETTPTKDTSKEETTVSTPKTPSTIASTGVAKQLFGNVPSSSFSNATATTTTTSSIFGNNNVSISLTPFSSLQSNLSTAVSSTSTNNTPPKSSSFFSAPASSSSAASIFSSTTTSKSSFSLPFSTASSGTSSTPTSSIFASQTAATTVSSPFSSTATSKPSLFGNTSTQEVSSSSSGVTASSTGSFGTSSIFNNASSTSSSIFGNSTATSSSFTTTTTTSSSLFGASSSITTSVFGAPSTATTSIFGTPATTTTSIFGTQVSSSSGLETPAPATSSIFGASTATTASAFGAPTATSSSIFGAPAATTTSMFGAPTSTAASVFGAPASTAASVFGAPASTAASVFGAPASTAASVFGAPASNSASVFGAPAPNTSLFGAPASTSATMFGTPASTSASVFGAPASNAASVFGAPTTSTTTIFGNSGGSVFGGGFGGSTTNTTTASNSIFGNKSSFTSGGSLFSQSTETASNQSPFSNATESVFGQSSSGGLFGGLGGKPSAENANKNVFGNPISEANPQLSLFGGKASNSVFGGGNSSGSNLFGNNATPPTFGGSSNTAPNQNPMGAGFTTPQKSSVFGGAPSFGGSPAFGASPTFGGSPAFGAAPSFGQSPTFGGGSTFGSAPSGNVSGGFGSFANSGGATFGGLSTGFGAAAQESNASSFGNLAQQSNSFQSNNNASKGSSFTAWR